MSSNFFAMVERMKLIDRWALMNNTGKENIAEHSHTVAVIAHALALIGNKKFGRSYNAERCALLALYHDTTEVITGDMPEEFRPDYDPCFHPDPADKELWQLVKAADKISALIKCIEEDRMGNREFEMALRAQEAKVEAIDLPEVAYFRKEFMPRTFAVIW